jgi:hypothetical protein
MARSFEIGGRRSFLPETGPGRATMRDSSPYPGDRGRRYGIAVPVGLAPVGEVLACDQLRSGPSFGRRSAGFGEMVPA